MRPSKICIDPTLYEIASYKTVEGILRRGRDSNSWYRINLIYIYHQRPFFLLWFLLMDSNSWEVEYLVWFRRAAISSK